MLIIKMKISVLSLIYLFFIVLTFIKNGRSNFETESRIINGDMARAGQFTFAAALNVTTSNSRFFCGGALLSASWILTSSHCIQNATTITISLGSNSLSQDDSNRVKVTTSGFDTSVHPEFDPDTLANDIGLIMMRQSVLFTDYIGKSYLPVTPYGAAVNVTAIGWGQINDNDSGPVDYLNFVKMVTISNQECRISYGDQVTDNMICVLAQYNEGICWGDSGGPLIYLLNNQHPIIIGVASFFSGNGCESLDPSGFTRVFPYRDWILSITGNLK